MGHLTNGFEFFRRNTRSIQRRHDADRPVKHAVRDDRDQDDAGARNRRRTRDGRLVGRTDADELAILELFVESGITIQMGLYPGR
jgi:hypothetical protein